MPEQTRLLDDNGDAAPVRCGAVDLAVGEQDPSFLERL